MSSVVIVNDTICNVGGIGVEMQKGIPGISNTAKYLLLL